MGPPVAHARRGSPRRAAVFWLCALVLVCALYLPHPWQTTQLASEGGPGATLSHARRLPETASSSIDDKFTIVAMTYSKRLPCLHKFVPHYSTCPSVAEIVLVWDEEPLDLGKEFPGARVRTRHVERMSLSNRFGLDPLTATRAVLTLDDDLILRCSDLERGFRAWKQHPDRLVGFTRGKRLLDLATDPPVYYGFDRNTSQYNVVLTNAAFMDAAALFGRYWEDANAPARALVDEWKNCEDILMNFILAAAARKAQRVEPPILVVEPDCWEDISFLSGTGISVDAGALALQGSPGRKGSGKSKGKAKRPRGMSRFQNASHFGARGRCGGEFGRLYGAGVLYTTEEAVPRSQDPAGGSKRLPCNFDFLSEFEFEDA